MMTAFDLHRIDPLLAAGSSAGTPAYEEALGAYIQALVGAFMKSPEGAAISHGYEYAGVWAGQIVRYGCDILHTPPARLTAREVAELLSEHFPRRVTLEEPSEAERIVPELLAFWQFLGRTYRLEQAADIATCLRNILPTFPAIMNDPAFRQAGSGSAAVAMPPADTQDATLPRSYGTDSARRKRRRKLAKAARKPRPKR